MIPHRILIRQWKSRGGRYWYNLYHNRGKYPAYSYTGDNSGGNLGRISETEAVAKMEHLVEIARNDGINLRVIPILEVEK